MTGERGDLSEVEYAIFKAYKHVMELEMEQKRMEDRAQWAVIAVLWVLVLCLLVFGCSV